MEVGEQQHGSIGRRRQRTEQGDALASETRIEHTPAGRDLRLELVCPSVAQDLQWPKALGGRRLSPQASQQAGHDDVLLDLRALAKALPGRTARGARDGVGELDGVVEPDRPVAAPSRSPSASWSASGCRHPTLRTRSFPSCPITGATHAVCPPGWKGSLRTSDHRSWSEATVTGSVGNQAARFSSPGVRTRLRGIGKVSR
ncbi:MAG: hypothetical protein M3Q29_05555, partial [Chloroflexota bacterium]|nr:hypothetical protein [Chloroflexota bacterium]